MNDNESQKNLLMAVALSLLILLGWQYFIVWPKEEERRALEQARQQAQGTTVPTGQPGVGATGQVPGVQGGVPPQAGSGAVPPGLPQQAGATALSKEAALAQSPRLRIETERLSGSVALRGARFDDLVLTKYRETLQPSSPQIRLFHPTGTELAYFAEYGWVVPQGQTIKVPDRDTLWTASAPVLSANSPVTLTWDNGEGLVFRRELKLDDHYMFTIKEQVVNNTGGPIALQPYARIFRSGEPKIEGWIIMHEGPIGFLSPDDKNGLKEIHYSDLKKAAETSLKDRRIPVGENAFPNVKGGWFGFTDKYWAATLIPDQHTIHTAHALGFTKTAAQEVGYQTDYIEPPRLVSPGATLEVTARLFAGAKEVNLIKGYAETYEIKHFDFLIDWGMFWFITKPLFWLIDQLYQLLGNFGLAILAVTVLVKAAFFPLANKSYESMAKMKKLQPDMERLREEFKDDKQKMQQELMALYQKHKINPAAGCLPILLQIPVFFALYKVLFVTLDMRHAPFFGWIRDLSAPDPTTIFNLFGLLPFNPGAIPLIGELLMVGVWPLLMGATMWVQMQLNPKQPDPTQQMIFNWMPVLFTFLLAAFPAGLVIYWAWSNALSIAQQYYIMRKHGSDIHLWQNLGLSKLFGSKDSKKA